jgi:hypothetical protein
MKIGSELHKYVGFGKYLGYTCTAIMQREKLTYYEMVCKGCSHGYKCKIFVKKMRGSSVYEYMATLTDDEEEYEEYWHKSYSQHEKFFTSVESAKIAVYKHFITKAELGIEKTARSLEAQKEKLAEYKFHLESATNPKK